MEEVVTPCANNMLKEPTARNATSSKIFFIIVVVFSLKF
jgi:hypothetical protein